MLKTNTDYVSAKSESHSGAPSSGSFVDLEAVTSLLGRRKMLICGIIFVCGCLGLAFALITPPSYRAVAQIVIDPRRLDLFQKDSLFTGAPVDVGTIESQAKLIGSERIASAVIASLNLGDDLEFLNQTPSTAFGVIKDWLGLDQFGEPAARPSAQMLLDSFDKRLEVRRVGVSYVIEISFLSLSAAKSATIANAVANAYIEDVIAGRLGAMKRAGDWLETRLEELAQRALAAEQTLANFKAQPGNSGAVEMLNKVRELESNVSTYRAIYDSFLQRYLQTVQQQSFPAVEARVAALANPPTDKNSPRTSLILAMSLAIGAALGTMAAATREILDGSVRTGDHLAEAAGVTCLGILPELQVREPRRKGWFRKAGAVPELGDQQFRTKGLLGIALQAPFSRFTETIRSIKIAADLMFPGRRCRVIGVSSCLPDEGKSTTAANFAQLLASSGAKVALIDADLRNPQLSLILTESPRYSLVDAVEDPALLPHAIWRHADFPDFHFLPARTADSDCDSFDVLSNPNMPALLARLASHYDYVILDFAPIAPVVDVRAALPYVDGFLLVARWGETSARVVERTVRSTNNLSDKLFGCVLNRVDMKRLKKYDNFDSNYYSGAYYLQYRDIKEAGIS